MATTTSGKADWYHLVSVDLGNGDNVGVVATWKWPDAFDGVEVSHLRAVQTNPLPGNSPASVRLR